MPAFTLPDEIAVKVASTGETYLVRTTTWTSENALRAIYHGLHARLNDSAAGKPDKAPADKPNATTKKMAVDATFAGLGEWLKSEPGSRTSLPQADSLFLAEARLRLRALGVASKIVVDVKTRDAVETELGAVVTLAFKAKHGKDIDEAKLTAWVAGEVAKLEKTVAERLAAATAEVEIDI